MWLRWSARVFLVLLCLCVSRTAFGERQAAPSRRTNAGRCAEIQSKLTELEQEAPKIRKQIAAVEKLLDDYIGSYRFEFCRKALASMALDVDDAWLKDQWEKAKEDHYNLPFDMWANDVKTSCEGMVSHSVDYASGVKKALAVLEKRQTEVGRQIFLLRETQESLGCGSTPPETGSEPHANHPGNISGHWSGPWKNTRGESGTDTMDITERPDGTITGTWSGMKIENGRRSGNSLTWEAHGEGRDYRVDASILADGTMKVNYRAKDSRRKPASYTGEETFARR